MEAEVDGQQMVAEGHHLAIVMVVVVVVVVGQEAGLEEMQFQLEVESQVRAMVLEAVEGFIEIAVLIDVVEAEEEADSVQKPIRMTVKGRAE